MILSTPFEEQSDARMPTSSDQHPEDFLPLHPFELRILLVLADGPAHGYPIIRALVADAKRVLREV